MRRALHHAVGQSVRRALAVICPLALALAAAAASADGPRQRDEIRAAFVYNIARFISWPGDGVFPPSPHFNFCLYRANFLGEAIATIAGKPLHRRTLHISEIASLAEGSTCHALLVPGDQLAAFQQDSAAAPALPGLTIADLTAELPAHRQPRENRQGIMVALVRKGANLGFEINLEAMRSHGYRASSELLKLAVIVVEEGA